MLVVFYTPRFSFLKNKFNVLSMLNVKYIVDLNENNALGLRLNDENLGDAWFIENIINVNNSNEEILSLNDLNYSRDCLSKDLPNKKFTLSETDNIVLTSRKSNELIYNYTAKTESFIVFSEAYYSKGWQAYIDGQKVEHYKINYLLRGMEVPKGDHEIKFIFNPGIIKKEYWKNPSKKFGIRPLLRKFTNRYYAVYAERSKESYTNYYKGVLNL